MASSKQKNGLGALLVERLPWWLVGVELIVPTTGCAVWSLFVFSLLPVSIAFLVIVLATTTFPLARLRAGAGPHFVAVLGAWLAATAVVFGLIQRFGPEPFAWLLG